jgi:hypothetical protein
MINHLCQPVFSLAWESCISEHESRGGLDRRHTWTLSLSLASSHLASLRLVRCLHSYSTNTFHGENNAYSQPARESVRDQHPLPRDGCRATGRRDPQATSKGSLEPQRGVRSLRELYGRPGARRGSPPAAESRTSQRREDASCGGRRADRNPLPSCLSRRSRSSVCHPAQARRLALRRAGDPQRAPVREWQGCTQGRQGE